MLNVTPRATDVIRRLLATQPSGGLRLAPGQRLDGCATIEIGVAIAPAPAPSDRVLTLGEARVFIDEDIVAVLSDRTLDVQPADGQANTVFRLLRGTR